MKKQPIYKPILCNITQWEDLEKDYEQLVLENLPYRYQSFSTLIKFIRNSDLHNRLFAYSYFHYERLVVTIYNPAERHRESIHIDLDRGSSSKRWCFEYHSKTYAPVEAVSYCNHDELIKKFCAYIKHLKW